MPVILAITYQKKLGQPNYSSHSCSVSLTVEIPDVSVVGQETARLYELLQSSVDAEIQNVGFMPDATTYGMNQDTSRNAPQTNGNGHSRPQNGNGYSQRQRSSRITAGSTAQQCQPRNVELHRRSKGTHFEGRQREQNAERGSRRNGATNVRRRREAAR